MKINDQQYWLIYDSEKTGEFDMPKAALHNLGCKVNAYETEAMQQLLEEARI